MKIERIFAWWPIPRLTLLGIFVFMLCGAYASSLPYFHSEYFLWSRTNRIIHDSLLLPGGILAGISAAVAAMIMPAHSIFNAKIGGRNRSHVAACQLGAIIVAAFCGHVVGSVPLLYVTAHHANGGNVSWVSLLVVFSGIVTLSSIGFFAGITVKRLFIAPIVAVACVLIMGMIQEPVFRPLALIFPTHFVDFSPRYETNPCVAIFSLIFACVFILAGLCSVHTGQNNLNFRRYPVFSSRIVLFLPTLCLIVLGVCAFVWRPELVTVHHPIKVTCMNSHGIRVCLHEQNMPAHKSVDRAIGNLQRVGIGIFLEKVSDDAAVNDENPAHNESFVDLEPGPFDAGFIARNGEQNVAYQMVEGVTRNRCIHTTSEKRDVANSVIENEIFQRAGYRYLTGGNEYGMQKSIVRKMSNAEFIYFLQTHKNDILTCSMDGILK